MPKKRGKKPGKKPAKLLDPLPGPGLLRPVLTYSEDNVLTDPFQQDDDEEPAEGDDGSLYEPVPPEYIFSFEDQPDIDAFHALVTAEENSDDVKSGSSYTDYDYEEGKLDDAAVEDSRNTESECTGSETDLNGYDIADLELSAENLLSENSSDEKEAGEVPRKSKKVKFPTTNRKTLKDFGKEPSSRAKSEWITRKFAELFTPGNCSLPLYTIVEDLLKMNIDFTSISPEMMAKLREIADASEIKVQKQNSGKFERPSTSSSTEFTKRKAELVIIKKVPSSGKKSHATPKKSRTTPKAELPSPAKIIPPYPAEMYEEQQRVKTWKKPWIKRDELMAANDEQDAWVTESCEDISFIEYRRERILRGKKVAIGEKDFELDVIAGRMAEKLLAYEAAVDKALPDAEELREEEERYILPGKPLVPVKVNPEEDPDDEETTSEEDQPKKEPKKHRHIDPYHVSLPVHEDDQYDYYNSERSSSECESTVNVIRKDIEEKLRIRKKFGVSRPSIEPLDIAGHAFNPTLPLDDQELLALPIDDLYALAHDLSMPPGELRKELQRPDEEMEYEQDSDEEEWYFVRGTFLYEKTPAFYAVQIKDLEQQIRLKREQWILLELEYNEFSVRKRVEMSALDEFIVYLGEERKKEKQKVAELQVRLDKFREQLRIATEYQTWWTNYLEEQKRKMAKKYAVWKEALQIKLFALREYIEKQRQMEETLATLRVQGKQAKASYTRKVSQMLLSSARKKNQLFRDYERRIGIVFKEYQRALVLSMNDNLQEACSAHVAGRSTAKHFSDRALVAISSVKKATDSLVIAQKKVGMREELLALSTEEGNRVERQLSKLRMIQEYEAMKGNRREEIVRADHHAVANIRRTQSIHAKNLMLDKLIGNLLQEQHKLVDYLTAEQSINKQMESHLGKLVTAINEYLAYLNSSSTDDKPELKLGQLETFEDRFIRYLHYAAEIEDLVGNKRRRPKHFFADGDLGFVPMSKLRKG